EDRLRDMLADAAAGAVLHGSGQAARAARLHPRTVPVSGHPETTRDAPAPARTRPGGTPAYLVFTSGTTGRPKGCVNTLDGLANRVLWMAERYSIGEDDVVLHKTPLSFDVSVWELVLPLTVGARMVVAPPEAHRDPEAVDILVETHGVT